MNKRRLPRFHLPSPFPVGLPPLALLLVSAILLLFGICLALTAEKNAVPVLPEEEPLPEDILLLPEAAGSFPITVLTPDGEEKTLELEEFLVGVVASEMPASFSMEALKAQAIAARSFILRRTPPFGSGKHGTAAVCSDPGCCQAYTDPAALWQRWGVEAAVLLPRIRRAVAETAGEVLTYGGAPIDACFCSTCGGSTEAAGDCWGRDVPYLMPVPCAACTHSPRYLSVRTFSLADAAKRLDADPAALSAMTLLGRTRGGRAAAVKLGGHTYAGTEVRSLLELDSAAFSWLIMGEEITFLSRGFGHGVGMCQYGADGMAREGADAHSILLHYFPGCSIQRLSYTEADTLPDETAS